MTATLIFVAHILVIIASCYFGRMHGKPPHAEAL